MDAHVRALYVRLSPWGEGGLNVQVGRVPPVFGAYPRRAYSDEGPLIGLPLVYQYLTTMRSDAVPLGADDLLAVRGRGWYVSYPSGAFPPGPGVPVASATRWDTGVQVRLARDRFEAALALTRGTLADPRVGETNDGKQLAGRVAFRPGPSFTFGVSAADGRFLAESVTDVLPSGLGDDFRQRAIGLDLEHALGHLVLRAELVASRFELPAIGTPAVEEPLGILGGFLEARYRVAPGWTVGARVDRLDFSTLRGSRTSESWDAEVTRVEAGVSFVPRRHVSLRAVYQYNWRDSGRYAREGFLAAQLGLWF
jgi:hypothetical protein